MKNNIKEEIEYIVNNTPKSLIADEVLKVVRMNLNDNFYDEWKKIKEEWWSFSMKKNNNNYDPAIGEIEEWFYYKTQESIRNLLSNLSPIKENKNNGKENI